MENVVKVRDSVIFVDEKINIRECSLREVLNGCMYYKAEFFETYKEAMQFIIDLYNEYHLLKGFKIHQSRSTNLWFIEFDFLLYSKRGNEWKE